MKPILTALLVVVTGVSVAAQSSRTPSFEYSHFIGCGVISVGATNSNGSEHLIVQVPIKLDDVPISTPLMLNLAALPKDARIWINVFDKMGPHNSPLGDVILGGDEVPAVWEARAGLATITANPVQRGVYQANLQLTNALFVRSDGSAARPSAAISITATVGLCGG